MPTGPPPDVLNPASFSKRMFQGRRQRIRHESQGIEKIALAAPVWSNENRQGAEFHVACSDTLVVLQLDASDEIRHGVSRGTV
jgi:hypothetical protein